MRLRVRTYCTAKEGNRLSECEDAVWASEHRGRFAIADGASQSWAAGRWARLLTERWVDDADVKELAAWVHGAQRAFGDLDQAGGADVPAYLRAQRTTREGVAHAAVVGALVEFEPAPLIRLVGVGDSCGFLVRERELIASVPTAVEQLVFDSTPALVMSCGPLPVEQHQAEIRAQVGDRCYLATDALAQALRDASTCEEPLWHRLDELTGPRFLDLVAELRRGGMENDDVALVVAQID